MKSLYLVIFFLLSILISSCNETYSHRDEQGRLRVVTTTGMLYDAVINIAGDKVAVQALMQPGVDPHLYKATQGDLKKLTEADLIIYNGLHLEGKMGEVFSKLGRIKPVLAAAEKIPSDRLIIADEKTGTIDPHVWFDASIWKLVVHQIKEKLQAEDPQHSDFYEANARTYSAQLDSLHQWALGHIATVPESQRVLITAHDAFSYFGAAYHVEVVGLQGISTLSEFGLKDVANLVNLITTRNIQAVFVETSVSPKAIEAVVEGCRINGQKVRIGGQLYSDAMGESGTPEGTYIGMFKWNVEKIVGQLGS